MERQNYWTKPLTRRRAIGGAAAAGAGVAGFALTGCGDDDGATGGATTEPGGTATGDSPTAGSTGAIKKDGILAARQAAIFASINPWKGLDSGLTWGFTVFDHLFYTPFDTLKPEMFLATGYEQPEATKIIFHLGEGVFQDKPPVNGRKVTASDVKASYEASRVQPGVSQTTFSSQVFKDMQTPDENTVVCNLNSVDAWAFTTAALSGPIFGSIIPREMAAQPDLMDKDIIGSGRYEFVSHQNGTNFKLKRFDKWRIKGEPYLAGIQYKLIQDQSAALAAFSAKEIDSVTLTNKLERDQLVGKHGDKIIIDSDLSRSVWMVQARGDGRYADARVRQAFNMAFDRKEFVDLMAFGEGRKTGIIAPAFTAVQLPEAELEATLWKFDPPGAKKLLTEAGFDFDKRVEIKYPALGPSFSQFAQIVSAQLEKNLGVKTTLAPEEFGRWLAQSLYGSDYQDLMVYPTLALEEPMTYMVMYEKQIGGRPNWGNFVDDELDGMIRKLNRELDDEKRFGLIKDLQRKAIAKAAPAFPIFVQVAYTATWGYVKDRVTGRGSYGLFNGRAWLDK